MLTIAVKVFSDDLQLNIPTANPTSTTIKTALSFITGFAAAISLLMITIAGFRYTISHGNPEQITKSKNTIVYAVVGLVLSVMAFSIVTFVIGGL